MNRISAHSISGGRNIPTEPQQLRRGRSISGGGRGASSEVDESLDLFSRRRGGLLVTSAAESDGQNEPVKLERISIGLGKIGRSAMDDLLDADIGKHDYDWLLTPPGTPLFPASDVSEPKPKLPSTTTKNNSTIRSVSTTRPSRLSAPLSENGHSTRPARSSSVTRPSISSTYSSSYISNSNRTSVLNTSSASVTSRPSTPGNRSTSQSTARPSMASGPARSRPSTPVKSRPPPISPADRTRPLNNSRPSTPLNNSRPSTPTARPRTPTNLNSNINSSVTRSTSRPSTPTRRTPAPAPSPTTTRSPSVGRVPTANGRSPAPGSRPSSPGPRARAPIRPLDLPDFPLDVPPNLRTKLPDRPVSAGRSRPGTALTVRANSNSEAAVPASSNRRLSLPIVSRGKFPENPPKGRLYSNGHDATSPEIQKPVGSEATGVRRPSKPATSTTTESTGFGRTISKKSLDMALRHMDIRQSMMGSIRGASLFPQSIRPASSKGRRASMSGPVAPVMNDEVVAENGNCNGTISVSAGCDGAVSNNGEDNAVKSPENECRVTRASELDLYGSTRYEAMMLKEDSKNMNWLHSVEDKSDQSPVFDHRFEPLPEPFGLL